MVAADFETVRAKLHGAKENGDRFVQTSSAWFQNGDTYETIMVFDHGNGEVDVGGKFVERPPLAYFGSLYGDALNCLRSALDHVVWGLSVRYQAAQGNPGPPPYPVPHRSPWKQVGFPVVREQNHWSAALRGKLGLVDPRLHSRFRNLQPFAVNPAAPEQAWLAMLDLLWNIDKHHVVHIGNLSIRVTDLSAKRRSDGTFLPGRFESFGPQPVDLNAFDAETLLGRITDTDLSVWPMGAQELSMTRVVGVNLFFDQGPAGLGKNMEFALGNMHNAVVYAINEFDSEMS